ncbi:endomucin isoform X6 [Pogoniulus pusillus]|uniref:endomucin isoform X6 n=1 Tax=Pogoniulus pusillus TaxID=488313 RepID=UPI0030B93E09
MKRLGIAFFFLAVLCACAVGEDVLSTNTVTPTTSAKTTKPAAQDVDTTTSQRAPQTTSQTTSVLATAAKATNVSLTTTPRPSSPIYYTTQNTTQVTTTTPPANVTTAATEKSDSPTNTTQASGTTRLAFNETLDSSSTKAWSVSSTTSLQNSTSVPGTSGLPVRLTTESTNLDSGTPRSSSGSKNMPSNDSHYSSIILPVVITLIVITLSVFSLVALYKMCQKKAPERQENGTEQTQSDKEGVKLLSVKTTSPETATGAAVVQWNKPGAGAEDYSSLDSTTITTSEHGLWQSRRI